MKENEQAAKAAKEERNDEALAIDPEPDSIDEAGDESFPASDPPARTPLTRIGCPCNAP